MDIVQEWSLPSIEIAREIEQSILRDFGDFRGAAPDEMDGYTEALMKTFALVEKCDFEDFKMAK